MIAVFCETPYHLLSALNLVHSIYNEDCALFFPETMFKSNIKIELRAESSGYIKDIYKGRRDFIPKSFWEKLLFKLYRMAVGNEKGIIKKIYPDINFAHKYNKIICTKYGFGVSYLYRLCDSKPTVIQIEEGVGDYLMSSNNGDPTILAATREKFVCEPKLLPDYPRYPLKKMPYLSQEKEFLDMLESIFGYREILPQYRRFIYFGQAFAQDYNAPAFLEREQECFDLLSRIIGEQLTLKSHPRNTDIVKCAGIVIQTTIPWECCANELEDIDDRVLISVSSTSILTPKLLCGKEPYLIILAKLYEDFLLPLFAEENYYQKMIALFEQVRNLYSQKDKVFIPQTFGELEEILQTLKS